MAIEQITVQAGNVSENTGNQQVQEGLQEVEVDTTTKVEAPEELIAGKFRTQEDLISAYKSLEGKLGQQPEQVEAKKTETKKAAPKTIEKQTPFERASAEYEEKGVLSEDTISELTKTGIPKEAISAYLKGIEAASMEEEQAIYKEAGGEEEYAQMVQWASANLSVAEIDAFNASVEANLDQAVLAVSGLKYKMQNGQGRVPDKIIGGSASSASGAAYSSIQEASLDMAKPEYKNNPAFRDAVHEKLSRSDI